MFPLNPRIGRYTYIILHLLAHPGRGHTNYSTKPEPILACGCTRKLLDMRIRLISLSLSGRSIKKNRQSLEYPGASIHPDVYLSCHLK